MLSAIEAVHPWEDVLSLEDIQASDFSHRANFNSWKLSFNREYTSIEEESSKYMTWLENMYKIAAHNSRYKSGQSTHTQRMNQFGDMTPAEFKLAVHGHSGSCMKQDGSDKSRSLRHLEHRKKSDSSLPDSVNWVTAGKVTPVKNQGQCGSCWAFSTTGSLECQYAIQQGTLNELSEQELVDCSGSEGNNGCNGGLMDNAFDYVKSNGGLCSETEYPYKGVDGTCNKNCGTKYNANKGHTDVTIDNTVDLETAVAAGCVSVAVEANQLVWQFYFGGVVESSCGTALDHGVLVVGYGTDIIGQKYWRVKNSWGSSWGDSGYILLCRDCSKNSGKGQCGILETPSYPTF
jgi:cathepsin L